MSMDSPVAILYDANGVALAVSNGATIPASTPALLLAGSDGTNARYLTVDSSGRTVLVGAGVAGTPAGGVLSIQGVTGGQPLPVSGTVTAANASVGTIGATVPAGGTWLGMSDGTNLQGARGHDLDTGAGTEWILGVSLRLPGSGGSVAGGVLTNPLRIDPTGTTTQPISAASLPLPTGAATETTLAGVLTTAAFQARVNTLGQKTMAASTPVVVASDQTVIPVAPPKSSTATLSNVASSATSVTLLASNANRLGAAIFNDSNQQCFVKFGTAASSTSYTVRMAAGAYFEVPFGYTGRIDGIWSTANGAARVTELAV